MMFSHQACMVLSDGLQRAPDDQSQCCKGRYGSIDMDAHAAKPPASCRSMCPVSDPALFESMVNHPAMLVMGVDITGRIMWLSQGMEQLTGWTFDELKGREWVSTLVPSEHQPDALERCRGRIGQDRTESRLKPI